MLAALSADDLIFQPSIGSANACLSGIEQLRTGQLVMTDVGKYRIATGDVASGNPLYVPNATGGLCRPPGEELAGNPTALRCVSNCSVRQGHTCQPAMQGIRDSAHGRGISCNRLSAGTCYVGDRARCEAFCRATMRSN